MGAEAPSPAAALVSLRERLLAETPDHAAVAMLGQRVLAAAARAAEAPPLPVQRIAILGSATTDLIARATACGVLMEGYCPLLYQAPYGAYIQEILDPASGLYQFAPELVLLALDAQALLPPLPLGASETAVGEALAAKTAELAQLWALLRERLGARIMQHMLVPPAARYRASAERRAPAAPGNQARALNARLLAAGPEIAWLELDRLAEEVGSRQWAAERFYHAAKLTFDPRFLSDYLAYFRGAWRSAYGRSRKLLALDLDNTLWGGVIGDDGIEGIALGPGSAAGEAYAGWGRYLKALRERGVILAVCSKNDPAIAESAFAHPHAVLRREDFAAFECSWEDKVTGLRRIAERLNLGIDSFVFADDNPAECALVARALPEVAVVPLESDPTRFIGRLEAGHWFDLQHYTREDLGRAEAYEARERAAAAALSAPDMASYLASLGMVGRLWRPGQAELERLAQLERKTNQFNLTTRRYSPAALSALLAREDAILLAFALADRFGEHGLVSSLVALIEGESLRIDSWLMSCRVFSRTAEAFIVQRLAAEARARGLRRLVGEYRPTPKNGVVADLYSRLGFSPAEGEGRWHAELASVDFSSLSCAIAEAGARRDVSGPTRSPADALSP